MARRVKGLTPGTTELFVPESYGNREDPQPVRVRFTVPTERERRELAAMCQSVVVARKGTDITVETKAGDELTRQVEALRRFVVSVENYTDAAGKPIADGAALAEHGESGIVFEVAAAIMSATTLEVDAAKKSNGSPATGTAAIQVSDGTAPSAQPPGSTVPGIVPVYQTTSSATS